MRFINTLDLIQRLFIWDDKNREWIRFKLWAIQIKWVKFLHSHLNIIALKKRQVGWSTLTGADSLLQCMILSNFKVLILSKTGKDAIHLLRRIRSIYHKIETIEELEERTKQGDKIHELDQYLAFIKHNNPIIKGADAGDEIIFKNGSTLISLSAASGRGLTANRVLLDEMAYYTPKISSITLDEVLNSVLPTTERTGGQVVGISTANGMNEFRDMFYDAVNKKSSYNPFFVSCYDDPEYTEEKRNKLIKDRGTDHVRQEHPRTYKEAFLASGRPRFDTNALEFYEQKRVLPPIFRGDLFADDNPITKNDRGNFKIIKPYNVTGQYILVLDVSEGIVEGDYSCGKVFDMYSWEQVAEWHGRIEGALLGVIAAKIGRIYNNALIVVEANNNGAATIAHLKYNTGYPYSLLFERDSRITPLPSDDFKNPNKRVGWLTTRHTRPLIIGTLALCLIKSAIPYLLKEDVDELYTFVIKAGKPQAETNCFDDRVMVIAIAYYLLNNETFREFYPLIQRQEHMTCKTCHYFKIEKRGDTKGSCKESLRNCDNDSWCTLWRLWEWVPEEYEIDG
jgi:hypothetical protein